MDNTIVHHTSHAACMGNRATWPRNINALLGTGIMVGFALNTLPHITDGLPLSAAALRMHRGGNA